MADDRSDTVPTGSVVPRDAPAEVQRLAEDGTPRVPTFDPTLGEPVDLTWHGEPRHRIVTIGDSLTHGFQSGAVFNTDLSYGAIVAHELGSLPSFRYPRYGGRGGLPINVELLLRDLERHVGSELSVWETPEALFRVREFMDDVEDYWERGPGSARPRTEAINHALGMYGWDLRDALGWTAGRLAKRIETPRDDLVLQLVQDHTARAALRVYPGGPADEDLTLFGAAGRLGEDVDDRTDNGIETLVVFLGANNALRSVTELRVEWSGPGYDSLDGKEKYTVWRPEHFRAELERVVREVRRIRARHVIWCTVPHVTIAPIARGVGAKVRRGSRYFPYYTRPWISDRDFDAHEDEHITGPQARAVDYAIDRYNTDIEAAVRAERRGDTPDGQVRDWYLLDVAGLLDRLASRRYLDDVNARPAWWTPYPLPPALASLRPVPDSRFLTGDGDGGRATGGLFSLDGVHPTTVGYGIVAQELVSVMQRAGVVFRHPSGAEREGPVHVDFDRLVRRDTLLTRPPQLVRPGLETLGWADQTLDWVRRALSFDL